MKEKEKKLTTRQWCLYNYLKDMYNINNKYISKQEICEALPEHYQIKEGEKRTCVAIEYDVRMINESPTIQKIIVSNKNGYKIGNEEEVTQYLNKRFRRDGRNMKLNWQLANKVALDNQTKLQLFGNERDFIETFIKEAKND